ncbi:MAG TPA: hypothetical protein VFC28_03135, partial [Opitutaceae bacterium]|nr:hypothetical protein [Opitutaceae bacterium]
MKQDSVFVISEFTNPSGEVVFRVSGWLDGKRVRKNFSTRAEADYAETATYADFVKPAMYNVAGGERMASFLDRISGTIFHDAKPEDVLPFYYKIMNYDEAAFAELPRAGLSAGYVARETRRVLDAVQGRIAV